jgi:hypothetical protein
MAVTGWTCLLRAHATLVAALLLLFGVLFALDPPGGGGGANIGLGLAGLPLIGLGLPWSWLATAAFDAWGPQRAFAHDPLLVALDMLCAVGGAPLNVALHALVQRWWRRRAAPAP